MNSEYNWKDGGIDPSFSRNADSDFVVGEVGQTRARVELHRLVASAMAMKKSTTQNDSPQGPILPTAELVSQQDTRNIDALQDMSKEKSATGRRIVSTTKRAAQNRNAQKAFRQRRDKYVKELEATAAEVAELHKTIEELRQENLQLRDYTLALQSRLIELSPNVTVGNVAHPQSQEFNKL